MDWPGWRAMFAREDGVETFEPLPRDFVDSVEASLRIVFDKLGQWFVN